jgi:hypothetical protein
VTATADTPVCAELPTSNVNVLLEVVGSGLNDAVTEVGNALALNVTSCLKPLIGVTVTVVIPLAPCAIVTGCGAIAKVKVGIGVTLRAMVVVAVKLPEVPVTVIVNVPSVAVVLALRVSTLVEVAGFRLKEAVTPVGNPAERVTLPAKPFNGVMVIVLLPWLPWATLNSPGAADNV